MAKICKRRGGDGKIWVFLSWLSLCLIIAMMGILGALICVNSFNALWPHAMERLRLADGSELLGFRVNSDVSPDGLTRLQYKVGNRDLNSGADFRWVYEKDIAERDRPVEAVVVNRLENGDFLGYVDPESTGGDVGAVRREVDSRLASYRSRWNADVEPLRQRLANLGDAWQATHLAILKAEYELAKAGNPAETERRRADVERKREQEAAIKRDSETLMESFNTAKAGFASDTLTLVDAAGQKVVLPLASLVAISWPNAMGMPAKIWRFLANIWDLLTQYPREANTEGGLFPALFGTVMLVFLMAISAFPLGVAAGIYLREYARDGFLSRTARVAVNNLAGVPSIVYGIFGLGFFIYGMGGTIDQLLYPERVAAGISTFGGGGIIWSSLTLGLLTLPVVIVATEEALATIPSEIRQGSLALGATRFQTLWRVILPMASPGILTGFILAMARAAGEVAPLMLTGAVKSAHNLPLDGAWPFVHLERKFMHLGFHIYDMGFQSPNVEASKPLVYLTALVLLILVFVLNIAAISLRRRMHEKYTMKGF